MNRVFLRGLLCLSVLAMQAPANSADWLNNEHALFERAKRSYQTGRFDDALRPLNDCISINPRSAEYYYWRGITLNSLGQSDRALADLNQAITLDPNSAKVYLSRGLLYTNKNQYDEAIDDFNMALKLDPDMDIATQNKKFCVQAIEDKKKAEEDKIAKEKAEAEKIAQAKLQAEQLALNPPPPTKKTKSHSESRTQSVASTSGVSSEQLKAFEKKQAELKAREEAVEAKLERERQERVKLAEEKSEHERQLKESSKPSKHTSTSVNLAKNAVIEEEAPGVNRPIRDKWALIVGISKFKDEKLNLRYPSKDAQDFYDFLIHQEKFAKDHVKLLKDEDATRGRILSELGDKWLPRVANPDDLVLIYISSHGSASDMDVGGVNYLLAHDTEVDNLYASGLPMQDLTRIIKGRVHADRIVLVLDACHSGATAVADGKGLARNANVNVDEIAQGTGQLVISSSQNNQISWESKKDQNSVFTKYLMEGLKAKGDQTTLGDAFSYMKNKVQEEVLRERGVLQTPVLKSKWEGKDLVISASPSSPAPGLVSSEAEQEPAPSAPPSPAAKSAPASVSKSPASDATVRPVAKPKNPASTAAKP